MYIKNRLKSVKRTIVVPVLICENPRIYQTAKKNLGCAIKTSLYFMKGKAAKIKILFVHFGNKNTKSHNKCQTLFHNTARMGGCIVPFIHAVLRDAPIMEYFTKAPDVEILIDHKNIPKVLIRNTKTKVKKAVTGHTEKAIVALFEKSSTPESLENIIRDSKASPDTAKKIMEELVKEGFFIKEIEDDNLLFD